MKLSLLDKNDKVKIMSWAALAILLPICFVSMYYSDIFKDYIIYGKIGCLPELVGIDESIISRLVSGLYSAFFGCGIMLLVINNPWKPIIVDNTKEENVQAERMARVIRIGLIIIYLIVTWIITFWK